ncbi:undecaprenyldiphospho-muramoylpentapeptide beta-N-acetylglucosaminyltransferase [Tissierella creatinophila]|uniref:UDP-N-acetylglucosamine--N-acetylmuramyl-(pentapeptide) pyrophosphoryl-undecaprenol N-acetylglucosamine transferase n=1 Tax=Tissierella creatinophila DSM 6911 TaxID=1123403 RepID=A0A1U7M979_TISCR|nr:undecaprenyldiphospho-muramoylpentapeptide beta-N-acetylglucosaminyltransferase [Tissierella creatinophila]OLS03883.1 UDP-N-acetylglucosamine--N-acetylmuramyl-pyrophosphoryl-undecaprenol N-acetylglucosamine transferase [Tissierella creatinophila DSM 6911]
MKYLISGGGTGGHIYPALAILNEIKLNDKDADILYVGTKEGLESKLIPKEGIKFKTIRVKGIPRSINKDSFIALRELIYGLKESDKIIKEFKPDIVIGTGGYVCGPVVYKAYRNKIPTLIHEQNAFPGITNKILSRFVDKVAVTFEESIKYFKYPDRVINTGNPIRREILNIDKKEAYKKLDLSPLKPTILCFGGSGGQKSLNTAIKDMIKTIETIDFQLIHITGERFYNEFMEDIKDLNLNSKEIKILPYLYEMAEALNIADIIVTSAGAITLAEISSMGIPSILIPKAYTAENHQEYNARNFEKKNAAIVILEKELNGENLKKELLNLLNNPAKLKEMAKMSKNLGKTNAAYEIYDIIKKMLEN